MTVKYQYLFTDAGVGYTMIQANPINSSSNDALTYLTINGVLRTPALGHIEDHYIAVAQLGAGDSQTDDELSLASQQTLSAFIWDEMTTSNGTFAVTPNQQTPNLDLYGAARYGMAGGGIDQAQAIDIFRSGQTATYDKFTTLVNLGYNRDANNDGIVDGVAFNTHVTMIGGPGRDLFIGGEASDTLYGGASGVRGVGLDALGDGLTGGGGNDIIYGGVNTNAFGTGLAGDDLFGFDGDDTLYGDNQGDYLSGDAGNDVMYGASGIAQGSGFHSHYYGGDGDDTIYASPNGIAAEFFYGGNSTDIFVQTPNGLDTGLLDLVSYQRGTTAIIANLTTGTGTLGSAAGDTYVGIEGLIGSQGDDTLTGSNAANFLSGWSGRDSVFGGAGNDTIVGHQDGLKNTDIVGWDGTSGAGVTIAGNNRIETQDLIINGGLGTDIFNISPDGDTGNTTGSYYNGYATGAQILTGIEIIVASAGADVINLTNGSNAAHDESVSIFAGNGNDVVFSGSANDLIVGDDSSGTASARPGSDTLFGGSGDDLIWGDYQGQPNGIDGAADTLYGGDGNDTIYGGTGDDKIFDTNTFDSSVNSTSIDGGVGSDTINAAFSNAGAKATISGGSNIDTGTPANNDGADSVFTSGVYDSVGANLGLGNDIFSGSQNAGTNKDIVDGQDGNDAIAGWIGGDTLFGGKDDDVLWGGAGSDIIYGGPGDDVIYPDTGGSDTMFGGTGIDYYYLSRADGRANQIYDEFRDPSLPDPVSAENYLVINPVISVALDNGDNYVDGTGVWESDRTITDDDGTDMVTVAARGPGSPHEWVLTVHNVGRDMSVNFDDRDITQIVLWNNDAGTIGSPNYNDAHTFQLYGFHNGTWTLDAEY